MKLTSKKMCSALVLVVLVTTGAAGDDAESLHQRQKAQEQALSIAQDLVAAVLDTQLQQLDENGMKSLPIYRDIVAMRGNMTALSKQEMPAIVELLMAAQMGTATERQTRLNAAREKIREVVVQLVAERQRLYRRMQAAHLSAEARQLAEMLAKAREMTRALPDLQPEQRERQMLAVAEDQADINKLYFQLSASLADVSTWSGPVAVGAADGVRVLRVTHVEQGLKEAAAALANAEFEGATASQQMALNGLTSLIEKLDEAQGIGEGDRDAAIALVREIIAKQNTVREQTRRAGSNDREMERQVEQQSQLHKRLGELAKVLAKFSTTMSLLEQAKAASFDATASLFEAKSREAVEQQGRVVGYLAEIESVLRRGNKTADIDKSAAELAGDVRRLEMLAEHVAKAASEVAAARGAAAAQALADVEKAGAYSSVVRARLADATERLAETENLETRETTAAIRSLQAEVASELADTRRRQKAVEVGELARAAEALERAAAAEEEIARQLAAPEVAALLTADFCAALYRENADAAGVADRILQGVKELAPNAAKHLEDAGPHMINVGRLLDGALVSTLAECITAGRQAAEKLVLASVELRKRQGQAGKDLETIAEKQLVDVDSLRQAVQDTTEAADGELVEVLQKLEEARQRVTGALIDQAEAEGRSAEASVSRQRQKIADLQRKQDVANQAAEEWLAGGANNPLDAAYEQQLFAEKAKEVAGQVPEPISRLLMQAAQAAREAARETLSGSAPKAERARKQATRILQQTVDTAEKLNEQTGIVARQAVDGAIQGRVGESAVEARKLVQASKCPLPSAARAMAALGVATEQAINAKQRIDRGELKSAAGAQANVKHALEQAAADLDEALQITAGQQIDRFRRQVEESQRLVERAVAVDPAGAADLARAMAAAERGVKAGQQPEKLATMQHDMLRKTEQAVANLTMRSQELERDRDLAKILAQLAEQQQAARDTIANSAEQLRQQQPGDSSATPIAAAQSLLKAQEQFAQAQLATGAGAAELSGQQQVANRPIREGLEMASRLGAGQEKAGATTQGGEGAKSENDGQKKGDAALGEKSGESRSDVKSENGKPEPAGQQGNDPKAYQLGTGLVPASPQVTAKQIAGPEANAAAAKIAAMMKGEGKGEGKGKGEGEGESESPGEGTPSATAKKGGGSKSGKASKNEKQTSGDLEKGELEKSDSRGQAGGEDAVVSGKGVEGEAWFAKLPPSVQAAIQAKSRGQAPRAYEGKLRRYFDGVD